MAKQKYVLMGPAIGAANVEVMQELCSYDGDVLEIEASGFVRVIEYGAQSLTVAVIRLAEGQSIKRVDG
jgi:hypothetical protein